MNPMDPCLCDSLAVKMPNNPEDRSSGFCKVTYLKAEEQLLCRSTQFLVCKRTPGNTLHCTGTCTVVDYIMLEVRKWTRSVDKETACHQSSKTILNVSRCLHSG